ncbi:gamma-glutamyl-gamma-aminobutyrate hydrolase family protein [Streptococcus plurextorum]|uniref:gamma-glutamyl-gamma-aminobutyrate hydrolase family protein n=1 Tax=Streptococcus plurextorum TaxID=456876 RepID=UPI0003F58052|nr:gamma-glutamyl-gamma-aminobutyrate hydrolase family protein [Streptococcus plurextorum]
MTKQMIIGIAANQRQTNLDAVPWSYTPAGFPNAIIEAGGLPLMIPINKPETAKTYIDMIDKLILTGGQNVNPKYYGEEKDPLAEDDYLEERDRFEVALVKEALAQKKPIFAVCRGMQLMNVILGGSLHQNIPNHWQDEEGNIVTQTMMVEKDSRLASIYENNCSINSYHRQAIKELAPGLRVVAESPSDHIIEAVESSHDHMSYLGVQWHPELLVETDKNHSKKLFHFIVNEL